ncbi:DUF4197 family protein [Pseudodesulfovibrio sp.]|uniref:DUF4197 family protein n=1 Tax=Pseudodesulfovibrio sp. TaxID=2035812 RepID=UPI00261441E7|nr:DUF4197 family protein [Pseudodesulfovibrio sp.]MDD3313065.1 DUF4197 family protein [Pseudodesulfovibrio sp.]
MTIRRISAILAVLLLLAAASAFAGWTDTLKQAGSELADQKAKDAGLSYTPSEAVAGVKEILTDSTEYATQTLTTGQGFAADAATALALPDWLSGMTGSPSLLATMNTAAQGAVTGSESSFMDAIQGLSVTDTASLLGSSTSSMTAITDYFASKSRGSLKELIRPVVARSAEAAGLGAAMNAAAAAAQVTGDTSFDVNDYLADRVLDSMFHYMGVKETELRESGGAGASALLQKLL